MSTKSTVAITLTALAAGAALGVLFAPDSGKGTRKKIAKKASQVRDSLKELVAEGNELVEKLKDDAMGAAGSVKHSARSAKEHVKDSASEMASTARTAAHKATN